jgi:hypothetical protein
MSESAPLGTPDSTPYERMTSLAKRVMAIPKDELDRRAAEAAKNRRAKKSSP